jgi:hypothetical protein
MTIVSNLGGLSLLVGDSNSGDATFDTSINVGNILTVVTILVSVSALLLSLAKDRRTRERDLADRVRGAAAKTLAKLERWQELALAYYEDVRPTFVDTSELLARDFDPPAARDALWRALEDARLGSLQRIRDEEIETAYVDLYAFNVSVYERFRSTLARLKAVDQRLYGSFVEAAQHPVLAEAENKANYTPANLGNKLRAIGEHFKRQLDAALASEIEPLRSFLASIIAMNDQQLLHSRTSEAEPA